MAKVFCDEFIGSAKVAVISKSYCPFCVKAKNILKGYVGNGLQQSDIRIEEIENRPDCDAIQDYMKQLTNARSVPRVFINGKFVGGGDEIEHLHNTKKLKDLF